MLRTFIVLTTLVCVAVAQKYQQTTPVPILKQINRHNEDGSYSYGYEGGDGSFKIETKYPNGEVYGKYGYVDDAGKVREIEYGASRRGFEPAGSDINVPPPTVNNDNNLSPLGPNEVDDGQYREDPSIYYKDDKYNVEPVKTVSQPARFQSNTFETNFNTNNNNQYQQQSRFRLQQQPEYQSQSYQQQNQFQQYQQQPFEGRQFQQQQYQPSQYPASQADLFRGHPATQFDINTGSYSVSYTG
ncbi:transcription factor mef2A [Bradysia coprophila]|uniref:transcription factor mef2A n=1 Tax=Bradysia coprophila TaxID=38358 RepID=UPI00187DBAE3|nr:transcription factor mef2A [Bradysia coprophila]